MNGVSQSNHPGQLAAGNGIGLLEGVTGGQDSWCGTGHLGPAEKILLLCLLAAHYQLS